MFVISLLFFGRGLERGFNSACTCLGSSAGLQGQCWWPFYGRGSLRYGQCVKAAGVLLGHRLLGPSETSEFPPALLDVAASLVWDGLWHEVVHRIELQVQRGCSVVDKAPPVP